MEPFQSPYLWRYQVPTQLQEQLFLCPVQKQKRPEQQALTDHKIDFVIKTGVAADAVKSILEK